MGQRLQERFPNAAAFLQKYRRQIPVAALLIGLVWDSLTLGRPDRLFDNLVLLFYILLAGTIIVVMAYRAQRALDERPSVLLRSIVQFSFGNLTSGLFVLYSISGTIAGNWVFFVLLGILLVGNEFFSERHGRFRFTIGIYYLLLLAYAILITPVLVNALGAHVFLLAGVASLAAAALLFVLLRFLTPRVFVPIQNQLVGIVGAVFLLMNILYFFNMIPPVPLALRDIGIYHNVTRVDGQYTLTYETPEWYQFWRDADDTFRYTEKSAAHCFSSVFAPTDLSVSIHHQWQWYDPQKEQWADRARIAFSITGGREEGYRGYSVKRALLPGRWRCNVRTESGALLGRTEFTALPTTKVPELTSDTR